MNASSYRLSFAIPTYNFAAFIEATIVSIFEGAHLLTHAEIEVVVVDGASSDNTFDVVDKLRCVYPTIRYVKMPTRGGIDFDLNHAVSLAQAPYVWLFSADDVLEDRWDQKILPLLETTLPDVMLIPAMICTLNMQPMRRNRIFNFPAHEKPELFDFSVPSSRTKYIQSAVTLEALFSYMSSVLVKNKTWQSLPAREDYFGSCWAHCARLLPLVGRVDSRAKIVYLNSFVIQKRTGNDSFMEHGLVRRIGITVSGWSRLIGDFFADLSDAADLKKLMARDASYLVMTYAKIGSRSLEEKNMLLNFAHQAYGYTGAPFFSKLKYHLIRCTPTAPFILHVMRDIVPKLVVLKHKMLSLLH